MAIIRLVDINNALRKRFEKDGMALRNMFEYAYRDTIPTIFVFDGPNAKKARRDIFPGYKVGRTPAPDNFYVQLDLFRELLGHTNKVILRVPGYEADDVIATLIKSDTGANEFEIDSNDGDFLRLCTDKIRMTSPPMLKDVPADEIRLYKTLQGDGSDKIPGVRLFGPKSWAGLDFAMKNAWENILDKLVDYDVNSDQMMQEAKVRALFVAQPLNLTAKQVEWCCENWRLIRSFWLCVDFLIVPQELIAPNMKVGKPNYELADSLLREVLQ